jgi:hypothetical protein
MTMTVGPSQVHFHGSTATSGLDFEMDMTCAIDESSATCTDSAETTTVNVASMATYSAEITAGADKLDNTGKCAGVSGSGKKGSGKGSKSAGGRLAVGMGLLGATSFIGMLML